MIKSCKKAIKKLECVYLSNVTILITHPSLLHFKLSFFSVSWPNKFFFILQPLESVLKWYYSFSKFDKTQQKLNLSFYKKIEKQL